MTTDAAETARGAIDALAPGGGGGPFLDDRAFDALAHRHRRELHVHCYRMLASFEAAEDAVQETFLRAWRRRETFDEDSLLRAWLYRVATNVCLDVIRSRSRRSSGPRSYADIPWLQPYPDRLLDEIAATDDEPDAVVVSRETIELAFLAALQVLPPRQRAVLVLRDVLGTPAAETATILDTTVAAANSALQRARVTMQDHLPAERSDWSATAPTAEERELLDRFIDADERCDADAALAIAAADIRITMPPNPTCFEGLSVIGPLLRGAFGPDRDGDWRLVPTVGNRMPVAASYLRRPGDSAFRAFKLDAIRVRDGRIAEITTFGSAFFEVFGLPPILEDHERDHVPTTPVTTALSLPLLGGSARNALATVGIERLDQAEALTEREVRDLPGMTDAGLSALLDALAAAGRSLRPS